MAARRAVSHVVESHNRVLRAAHSRIDGHLEERLAGILQPILEQAGNRAASRFTQMATHHLTAAALRRRDEEALTRLPPGAADDGFFGYRLRPIVLTATAPTPDSAMICVKPRPDEAAALAFEGGEPAESLHVTLCYLGPLPGSLQSIADALAAVAASHAPLVGVVGGVGKFEPPGMAILLPDVPGLVELRVAITEALAEADVYYARNHGFEAHISIDAEPDPETLEEALRRSAQKPLHFDSILLVRGDEVAVELPLVGPPPITASGLTAAGDPIWTGPAGDELIDVDALVKTLRTKTDPVRNALLKATMDPALKDAGLSFDVTNPLTAKILAQSGSQIKGIAETTQLNVMRIIGRSYNEGLSIPDTAKAIRAGMASASNYRARMIARTELAGAANGGSLAATQLVADTIGVGFFKQWLTAPGAPHPRHEDYPGLDEQTVALDATFDVGGNPFQFPGDPDGAPEDSINCRCALAYTETPPEGRDTGAAGGGLDEQGASTEGTSALEDVMPLTPPPGDTVSVGAAPFVPMRYVEKIKAGGLDKGPKEIRPTTPTGKKVYADALSTDKLYDGGDVWTEERKTAVHNPIEAKHFEGHTPPAEGTQKEATLTAGGSGSGKSGTIVQIGDRRFTLEDLEEDFNRPVGAKKYPDVVLINADLVKGMIPEFQELVKAGDVYAASGVHEESSVLAKEIERLAREKGYHIVFDGTGASDSFVRRIAALKHEGYEIHVQMSTIPTNEAIVRAMERGDGGGRYVAMFAIKDAHRGSSRMLGIWQNDPAIRDWQVWDNSVPKGAPRILVAEKKAGETVPHIYDQKKFDEILAKANEGSQAPGAATFEKTAAATMPTGGTASEALVKPVMLGRADGGPEVRDALAAIDSVHRLPPLDVDPVPVTANPSLPDTTGARLVSHTEGSIRVPDRIEVNPLGTKIEFFFAHEIGHEIDYALLRGDSTAVVKAAHETDAWKALTKLESTHAEYLRRDREVFARAYAQWIAERSGNPAMAQAVEDSLRGANEFGLADAQWSKADFAPIGAEFDRIFGERGLLVGSPR